MRFILIIVLSICITSNLYADDKSNALNWWLKSQGKLNGATVVTEEKDGDWKITEWNVDGVSKPTNSDINAIVSSYKEDLETKKSAKLNKRAEVLAKLGITEEEWKELL